MTSCTMWKKMVGIFWATAQRYIRMHLQSNTTGWATAGRDVKDESSDISNIVFKNKSDDIIFEWVYNWTGT